MNECYTYIYILVRQEITTLDHDNACSLAILYRIDVMTIYIHKQLYTFAIRDCWKPHILNPLYAENDHGTLSWMMKNTYEIGACYHSHIYITCNFRGHACYIIYSRVGLGSNWSKSQVWILLQKSNPRVRSKTNVVGRYLKESGTFLRRSIFFVSLRCTHISNNFSGNILNPEPSISHYMANWWCSIKARQSGHFS